MAHHYLGVFLLLLVCSQSCLAQDETKQEADKPKVEMVDVEILVVDPYGNPVEDAEIYCTGLRTKVNRASHYSWVPSVHGERQKHKTDDRGVAKVVYPKFVSEKLETGHVTWSVEHSDFVTFRGDIDIGDEEPRIQLEQGFRIALNAVDGESGDKIDSDLYVLMGLSDSAGKWEYKKNGMLVSPVYSPSECVFRVVHLAKGQPSAFSDLIKVKPKEGNSRILLKDVKIYPGVSVKGTIDEAVPRPVKAGVAIAGFVNNPNKDREAQGSWRGRWQWNDTAKISEDGTFEFESVPRDEFIQLFIRCNGWTNARPTKEDVLKEFPQFERKYNLNWLLPHFEKLESSENEITVPMIKNSLVTVTVKGPDGKPLKGAGVSFFPQQLLFGGGGIPWGFERRSRESLMDPVKDPVTLRSYRKNPLSAKTDADGRVELLAPPCSSAQIMVFAEGHKMGINRNSRSHRINVKPGKSEKLTIEMVYEDSEKLGEN